MSEYNATPNEFMSLINSIKGLNDIDEDSLTDEAMRVILKSVEDNFTPAIINQTINQIVGNLEDQGLNKAEASDALRALAETFKDLVYGEEEFTGNKKILIDTVMNRVLDIFDKALEKYHSYSIVLPMTLAEGAKVPTYAHETDAAADLYALEDKDLNAHTYGNLIRTGVKIQLPEGWLAMILPRSSIGSKTPFRLSNSVGLIDSSYRGELGVLYDNTSDSNAYIKAGDRIAQLLVMPSYRFQPQVVDALTESDRGEGGFGSTGA